jgi:hypothetical protein
MEALSSSEMSVLTRATWRNIPEDTILHNLPSNLKSLMNEKVKFKEALNRYLDTYPFYSVDEFLVSKTDSSP